MKKNFYTLLTILVLLVFAGTLFMFVGCDTDNSNPNPQPADSGEPVPTSLVIRMSGNVLKLKQGNLTENSIKSRITVKVEMSDKTMQTVTDYTITNFDPELVNRPQAVEVHYGDLYDIVLVEIAAADPVAPTITKITVDKTAIELPSDKATVAQIKSSITVKAVYSDNSERIINDYTVEGFDAIVTDAQTVTIKHGELNANLTVTVVQGSVNPDTVTVYYYNIKGWATVNYHAWNGLGNKAEWPGEAMTAVDGHDGWYQAELPTAYTGILFNDGGNGGQTGDLTIDASKPYYNGVEWVNDFKLHEGKTTRTLYFYNYKGWSTVKCYAWKDSVNNGWPGIDMTAVDGHENWYQVEVSLEYVNVIFNDGTNQTDDLAIDAENVYYDGAKWVNGFTK